MSKIKVLIVDDEKIALKAYAKELRKSGYTVYKAETGNEGVEIARSEKPDIVFTDLIMPDINGVEVCKMIKAMDSKIEVVLISGHPEEAVKYQLDFVDAGGREEWLRKPLEPYELTETVKKYMEKSNEA